LNSNGTENRVKGVAVKRTFRSFSAAAVPIAAAIMSPKVKRCVNLFRLIAFLLLLRECRLVCANDLYPVYETIRSVDVVMTNHLKHCSAPEDLSWAVLDIFPALGQRSFLPCELVASL
jgi:hypothetical protein